MPPAASQDALSLNEGEALGSVDLCRRATDDQGKQEQHRLGLLPTSLLFEENVDSNTEHGQNTDNLVLHPNTPRTRVSATITLSQRPIDRVGFPQDGRRQALEKPLVGDSRQGQGGFQCAHELIASLSRASYDRPPKRSPRRPSIYPSCSSP